MDAAAGTAVVEMKEEAKVSLQYLSSCGEQPCRGHPSELFIFDIWNDNLQSFNREKNEASVPVFYADWTSVPVPRASSLRGLDVGFIPLLPKELPYMANNDEYTDEYLCRDFFVGFNFWSRLSFQISEFRVHGVILMPLIFHNGKF